MVDQISIELFQYFAGKYKLRFLLMNLIVSLA